jgi:excisionase family DNA binding protein
MDRTHSLETDGWLSVREVAQHLKLSRNMVYRLIKAGRIRTLKFGAAVRIPRASLHLLEREALSGQSSQQVKP